MSKSNAKQVPSAADPRQAAGILNVGPVTLSRQQFLRWLTAVTMLTACASFYLNFHAEMVAGIQNRFENQALIIRHGFDTSLAVDPSTLTYPVWGYGWLYAITQNHVVLMAGQMILSVVATLTFIMVLGRVTSDRVLLVAGTLAAIALPWYSLHTTITLYSPSSSLLAASLALLLVATTFATRHLWLAVASGVLFGICLNFRSDFVLMPVGLAAIVILFWRTWASVRCMVTWIASIAVVMVPWLLYTWHVVGVPLVTSTNGGHAMFVGLGQLPGNCWGITASDVDPLMLEIVDRELGPGYSSLSYPADRILKREFRARVLDRPDEFARKVAYITVKLMTQGAYPGEFMNTHDHRVRRTELVARAKQLLRKPWNYLRQYGVSQTFRTLLVMISYAFTLALVLFSFVVLPINAWWGLRRGSLPVLLVLACIVYHALLQVCVYSLPQYTSSFLLLHMANLGFAADHWVQWRSARVS